jgi:NADPH:quinone reductase-like Zn-dependent oxidoreductase
MLGPAPTGIDFARAAALPLAGVTALQSVEALDPKPGERVLIVGAGGGVGSYAVQLAAQRGATVIATGRPDDEARLRALGAAEVIDYGAGDVPAAVRTRYPEGVDALIDLVHRGDDFTPFTALVARGGRLATTMGAANPEQLAARNVAGTNIMSNVNAESLARLAELVESGRLRPPVERTLRLDPAEVKEGVQVLASGRARGKIAIAVDGGA